MAGASALVLLNAAAALTETTHPQWALRLNPLNTEARINSLGAALSREQRSAQELGRLKRDAEALIDLSPGDARGYSLLGEVYRRAGERDAANQQFRKALALAPTEINALLNLLQGSLREGALDEAVNRLDVILRRWPGHLDSVSPALAALAGDRNGAVLLRQRLAADPPWRRLAMRRLMEQPAGLALAQQLLIGERAGAKSINVKEVSQLIAALIRRKAYFEAYRVFLLTLSPQERQTLGYVFNHDFRFGPDARAFNWRVRRRADADVGLPYRAGAEDAGGLAVRFRGTPAELGNISQTLALPAGRFTLSAEVTGHGLTAPKGLFWEISCHGRGGRLARLRLEPGSYRSRALAQDLVVPQEGCPLQDLRLRTGLVTPTWRAGYEGTLIVHQISVVKQP